MDFIYFRGKLFRSGTFVFVVSSRIHFLDPLHVLGFSLGAAPSLFVYLLVFAFYPVKSSFITGHAGWRESRGWRELLILRVPGSRTLFEPRAARDQVPQETPGVLLGDGGRQMFPHIQRKYLSVLVI